MLPVYGKVRFVVNKDMINTRGERTLSVIAARCHLPREGEVLLYLSADDEKLPLSGELARRKP
jgi:hypothetical protein